MEREKSNYLPVVAGLQRQSSGASKMALSYLSDLLSEAIQSHCCPFYQLGESHKPPQTKEIRFGLGMKRVSIVDGRTEKRIGLWPSSQRMYRQSILYLTTKLCSPSPETPTHTQTYTHTRHTHTLHTHEHPCIPMHSRMHTSFLSASVWLLTFIVY